MTRQDGQQVGGYEAPRVERLGSLRELTLQGRGRGRGRGRRGRGFFFPFFQNVTEPLDELDTEPCCTVS